MQRMTAVYAIAAVFSVKLLQCHVCSYMHALQSLLSLSLSYLLVNLTVFHVFATRRWVSITFQATRIKTGIRFLEKNKIHY